MSNTDLFRSVVYFKRVSNTETQVGLFGRIKINLNRPIEDCVMSVQTEEGANSLIQEIADQISKT
jgi:hypothetical protein